MARKSATKIEISEKEREILKENASGTHTPLHIKMRSQIILYASEGKSNHAIKRELEINIETVRLWRDRYGFKYEEMRRTEIESPQKMRRKIEEILTDEQRAGAPSKYLDEQVAAIIALACEDPMKMGLPFSHWSPKMLQIEVIKLGIVGSISVRQIGRFLKGAGVAAAQSAELAES